MMTAMDKDRLAAFVDGELSPEEAAAVVMHLADHPQDQAYVDDLFAANAALQQAFAAPIHGPIPDQIHAAIFAPEPSGTVLPFARGPRRALAYAGLALAASVAFAAVLLPGLRVSGPAGGIALGQLAPSDPLHAVFDRLAAGTVQDLAKERQAMILATLRLPDGRLCREVEVIDRLTGRIDLAVGCRAAEGWMIEIAVAEMAVGLSGAEGQALDEFVPAGGAEIDLVTDYLQRSGTPTVLDPAAEAALLATGWR